MGFYLAIGVIVLWFVAFFAFVHETQKRKALEQNTTCLMLLFTFAAPFLFMFFTGMLGGTPVTAAAVSAVKPPLSAEGKIADDGFTAYDRCMDRANMQTNSLCFTLLEKARRDILRGTQPVQ